MGVVDPGKPSDTDRPSPDAVTVPLISIVVVLSLGLAVTVTFVAAVGTLAEYLVVLLENDGWSAPGGVMDRRESGTCVSSEVDTESEQPSVVNPMATTRMTNRSRFDDVSIGLMLCS